MENTGEYCFGRGRGEYYAAKLEIHHQRPTRVVDAAAGPNAHGLERQPHDAGHDPVDAI